MASFNADILLAVKRSSQLDTELRKLDADIDKIARKAADIKVGAGVRGAERARLKAEQEALKVRAESFGVVKATTRELERQAKVLDTINNVRSQRIARINNERARGLGQFASPIGPQPDRLAAKRNAQLKQRQKLASTIAFQTKLELQFAQRLSGVEKLITKEQQKQISAGQSLQRQKERALKAAAREAKLAKRKGQEGQGGNNFGGVGTAIGFPLLFGGGPGSVIGALLGSSGGFGGQILGSALGQQFDKITAQAIKLGKALNPLTADIEALTKAAGLGGTATEQLIKGIEKEAGAKRALEVVSADLARRIGQDNVDALKEVGDSFAQLERDLNFFVTSVLAAAARLLQGPIDRFAGGVSFEATAFRAQNSEDPRIQSLITEASRTQSLTKQITLRKEIVRLQEEQERIEAQRLALTPEFLQAQKTAVANAEDAYQLSVLTAQGDTQASVELEKQIRTRKRKVDLANAEKEAENDAAKAASLTATKRVIEAGYQKDIFELNKKSAKVALDSKLKAIQLTNEQLKVETLITNAVIFRAQVEGERLQKLKNAQRELDKARIGRSDVDDRRENFGATESQQALNKLLNARRDYDRVIKSIIQERNDAMLNNVTSTEQLDIIEKTAKVKEDTANREFELTKATLSLEYLRLKLAEQRANTNPLRQLQDSSERIQLDLQNPFGGSDYEQQIQLLDQRNRRFEMTADLLSEINAKTETLKSIEDQRGTVATNLRASIAADQKRLGALDAQLTKLEGLEKQQLRYNQVLQAAQPYAEAFANGLTQGLRDVVAGTKTAEEAFADFLNNIADMLIQTAATMIAQYIAIGIARAFAGLGSNPATKPEGFVNPNLPNPVLKPLAEGGYVTGPQPAIVGEGGEPEYIIPASKMAGAMARYSGGTRGDAVIDGPGSAEGGGGVALAEPPMSITIEGGVTQIGNDEYIRKDQLPTIISQASKAGEQRTLRKLQMSTAARKRLGM